MPSSSRSRSGSAYRRPTDFRECSSDLLVNGRGHHSRRSRNADLMPMPKADFAERSKLQKIVSLEIESGPGDWHNKRKRTPDAMIVLLFLTVVIIIWGLHALSVVLREFIHNMNPCKCENGVASSSKCGPAGGANCEQCDTGFSLFRDPGFDVDICVGNVCKCPEGVAADGAECPVAGMEKCLSCIDSHILTAEFKCEADPNAGDGHNSDSTSHAAGFSDTRESPGSHGRRLKSISRNSTSTARKQPREFGA